MKSASWALPARSRTSACSRRLSVLDNVKTGLHNQITYSLAESMFHLGSYRKKEKQMDEKAMELLRVFDLDGVAGLQGGQPAVRQAAQAGDRRVRWPPTPSCCCSTSLPPA